MRPLASFSREDEAVLRRLIGDHPLFRLYLESGLEASRRGETNRFGWVSRSTRGGALGIRFDNLEVRTPIGELTQAEELEIASVRGGVELHLEPRAADRIAAAYADRLRRRESLRYYVLDHSFGRGPDACCRQLAPAEYEEVSRLFHTLYPEGVFSRWMLDDLFLAVFEEENIVACGGVIARTDEIANIGNFLTVPNARGQGLARSIAATLAHRLADQGVRVITLTTTEENAAACRAYEAVGFRCLGQRAEVSLAPSS